MDKQHKVGEVYRKVNEAVVCGGLSYSMDHRNVFGAKPLESSIRDMASTIHTRSWINQLNVQNLSSAFNFCKFLTFNLKGINFCFFVCFFPICFFLSQARLISSQNSTPPLFRPRRLQVKIQHVMCGVVGEQAQGGGWKEVL